MASTFVYTYDETGRLLTVTKNGSLVEEYRYDLKGARNYETNSLRSITGRSFTYSDEDHLFTVGSVQYNYDVDGFLVSKTVGSNVTQYNYSTRGELLTVTLPDSTQIEYIHDPLGRRIAKKVNGTIIEKYLWQGLTRLLAVYDGANNLLMRFQYADVRMPVSIAKEGVTYYLTYDQVGSLRTVADSAGNVVKRIDYDSFGNIITDTNPAFDVPFGFAGGLYDRDTELVRFGYRDYDPDVGRWTAKDPILFADGDTDLYGYVLNDPVNFIDPEGKFWQYIIPPVIIVGVTGFEFYKHMKNASIKTGIIQELDKQRYALAQSRDLDDLIEAREIEQAIFKLQQMACKDLVEALKNVPTGTTFGGTPTTSIHELAKDVLAKMYMDYYYSKRNNGQRYIKN